MTLVVLVLRNPTTLEFTMTRPDITSFDEVVSGYREYIAYIQRAAAQGTKLHVILNLRAVTKVDPRLMSYVSQMRDYLKTTPDLPPTVTQLTVQLPSPVLRVVLKQILQFCVGKHVKVSMEA